MKDLYTPEDVYYELSTIRDPERRNATLVDLDVVAQERCHVTYFQKPGAKPLTGVVSVVLKPTVPHCSLMSLITLCVYSKLKETLPPWMCDWKIDITLVDGSHLEQKQLEKQIADKERVAAALENEALAKEIKFLINADDI